MNMLDYSTWYAGNTSATGFSRNGGSNENILEYGEGPYGENTVLWRTQPDGTNSGADGGWNSSFHSVDHTKKYRFSVWMKRISTQANGTFYMGTNGGGSYVLRGNNGAEQGNPYFECRGVSGYTKDVWYLVVGHVFPSGTGTTSRDSQTGVYTMAQNGQVFETNGCNLGGDAVMQSTTTSLRHRTYHYYANSSGTELVFAHPRMEEVTSSTPNIVSGYLSGAFTNVGTQGGGGAVGGQGAQGGTGAGGAKGIQGPKGITGIQGPKGFTGNQGARGGTGPQGPKGGTGAGGAKGILGPGGPKGPVGGTGAKGITGGGGAQGPKGGTGAGGAQGPKGITGGGGAQGIQGPGGPKGPVGGIGAKGITGGGGAQGPGGPKGPVGSQGPGGGTGGGGNRGPQGPKGITGGTGGTGAGGAKGFTGAQGARGGAGPTGPKGTRGPGGGTGLTGGQGGTGAKGPQGKTGPTGPQGDAGKPGAAGAPGPQGPQGAQNSKTGAQGVAGPQGPQGPAGNWGGIGSLGPTGPKGPKGQTGAIGPAGPPGEHIDGKPKSDSRLKDIAGTYLQALEKVKLMNGYYFYANELADEFGFDRVEEGEQKPRRIGLIAQELQEIEPLLVDELKNLPGYYTINYAHLNSILIEAMKELDVRAEAAKNQAGL